MKNLLNEFIAELTKTAAKEQFDIHVLQQKFDAWKEDLQQKQQEELQKKEAYLQKHHLPRVERDTVIQEYLEEYARLREMYKMSTATNRNANLRTWLTHASTIPERALESPSTQFTMYPYQETAFYSLPNVEKPIL